MLLKIRNILKTRSLSVHLQSLDEISANLFICTIRFASSGYFSRWFTLFTSFQVKGYAILKHQKNVNLDMVNINTLRQLALSFPGTEEKPHFEKPSFRVAKKIFATLDIKNHLACIKLSAIDQDVFAAFDKTIIYPVPNKWGKQGWTFVNLKKVQKDMFADALTTAYVNVAPKKMSVLIKTGAKDK